MGDDQIGAKNTESDGPTSQGERTPRPRISPRFLLGASSQVSPFVLLGDLWCYILLPLVHPLPTLVSHPCPYLSACPIGHSFWRSVSGCGPECTVQESHPHKWGQGISWRYLIQRWQLLLGLLFYYAPMVGPLDSELLLRCSKGLPLATWRFPLLWFWFANDRVVLGNISWQSGFPLFVLKHFFLFGMGLGPNMKWAGLCQILQPHNDKYHYLLIIINWVLLKHCHNI